jgi:hypothetical protein
MSTTRVNKTQLCIGITALLVGVLVYLVDRPPDTAYFLTGWAKNISLYGRIPTIFGPVGKNFPAFAHVFSFILITAGILGSRRRGYLYICIFWLFIDGAFELGQRYDSLPLMFIPSWFEGIPFLENTANFFRLGTFDYRDLASFFLGTVVAYIVLVTTMERREFHEKGECQIY